MGIEPGKHFYHSQANPKCDSPAKTPHVPNVIASGAIMDSIARPPRNHWRFSARSERVVVQFENKITARLNKRQLCYASSTAFQTAGVLLSLTRNPPRLNWPLWIRRSSSIPAMTVFAVLNHLKPSIGARRSFTPR